MSYVTILWSTTAAAALLLALVHFFVWVFDRTAWTHVAFAVVATAVAGIVPIELGMMYSATPEEWGEWVRWCQVPVFLVITGIVVFIRLYLGTGRLWLAGVIIALRCVILVWNFSVDPNFNFQSVESVERTRLLGEPITVVGTATTAEWQWLATLAGVLFIAYVIDASITLWRRGGKDARRRAAIIGGSLCFFVLLAIVHTQIMIWGLAKLPVMIAIPFLLTLSAMALELSRDILRAPRLARELGESEQRLSLAARAAGLGLWSWDIVHDRIWATERARHLFGFSTDEKIEPHRWLERVHPEDQPLARAALELAVAGGQEYDAEYRVCIGDDPPTWVCARGRGEPDSRGRPVLVHGVVRDISERKRALDESEELRRDLAHAGRVTMLGQLASALAHELSQPLAAILRNAESGEMILRTPSPDLEDLRAIMEDICRDDRRAGDIIDRLRGLLKRRRMEFQAIAVDGLVQEVGALVRSDAIAKQVSLEYAVASGLPRVSGDRVHLSQVLINLIVNGMDAIGHSARTRRVVGVAAKANAESLIEVAVTDSGSGIPKDVLNRLFEPFFTTKSGGMGMGLAVSRLIVEAHGGRLWAENNPTGGATFRFTVPAVAGER
jgi:two-component system, LuxR family, sensor kinase FixL